MAGSIKRALAGTTLLLVACLSANAGVLLGTGTLNNTDDLTRVQSGSSVYDFLDLSLTSGFTVAGALAAYGGSGFRWADAGEVAELYGAFGINYLTPPAGQGIALNASAAANALYLSYLGTTYSSAALGFVETPTAYTYSCISINGACGLSGSFVANFSYVVPEANSGVGIFLVRDEAVSVPEPGSLALVGLAVGALAFSRRRDSHVARRS